MTVAASVVLTVIDELAEAKGDPSFWLIRARACRRCKAGLGQPCKRPDDSPYLEDGAPRHHAPRVDPFCRIKNDCLVVAWREDIACGVDPAVVLREIQRTKFYRLTIRDQRATAPMGARS